MLGFGSAASSTTSADFDGWLERYAETCKSIDGWLDNNFLAILKLINAALNQPNHEVPGGALEIGVHYGRLFIALNAMVPANEKSIAIDVFEDQHLNIDGSGYGNSTKFRENLKKFDLHQGRNVIIEKIDSTHVTAQEVLAKVPAKFKIISIDGGHTAAHTISDLRLSNELVQPFGFVVVDDILNKRWLGVIDGVIKYLQGSPTLVPISIGYNKLVMCRLSAFPAYRKFFQENFKFHKTTQLCGYDILAV